MTAAKDRTATRVAEARKALGEDEKGKPLPAGEPDPPVYDKRGNVRPRGTEGAKPMTLAQRKAIAARLQGKD